MKDIENLPSHFEVYISKCRPGDWEHAKRVVSWIKELGGDRDDLDLLVVAGYIHDIGWWNAIKQEYSLRGGVMFVVEIVFIFLVLVWTVTFEIWQLAHNDEAQKRRDAIQLAHAKKNGVTEADIQEQEELLNAKSKKKHK